MIEEIKQALEKVDAIFEGITDHHENDEIEGWLRYLIGEVDRLKSTNKQIIKTADVIDARNQDLQKALEWYAGSEKLGWRARETLERTKP